MNRERRCVKIVVDRKAVLAVLAVGVLVGAAGLLSSQQLTMSATYPIPAGVYNQIVTTGNSGTVPANTTLNSQAGNTILVPPTNAGGGVGIGAGTPVSKLDVRGGISVGSYAGTTAAPANGLIVSGNVGVGTASPASALTVAGGVQLGDDASACTAAKAGTQRWHVGAIEVCSAGTWIASVGAFPTGAVSYPCSCGNGCASGYPITCRAHFTSGSHSMINSSSCTSCTLSSCAPGWAVGPSGQVCVKH